MVFLSMTIKCAIFFLLLLALSGAEDVAALEKPTEFVFAYITRHTDPSYSKQRAYTGLKLRENKRLRDAVVMALQESRILGRVIGIKFKLVEVKLEKFDNVTEILLNLNGNSNARVFLLDLPLNDVVTAGKTLAKEQNLLLFNIRHGDNSLRAKDCSPVLFHTYPSNAMLMDSIAQYLVKKKWSRIFVLHGSIKNDKKLSKTFSLSAKKFGLNIVEEKEFTLSNNPRLRDQTNISLLTGSTKHDIIFLADTHGEFGRYIPYNTYHPRPVIGSEGLTASAWHWTWERHGAPQLNQRFDRRTKRLMKSRDWAAWVAVRSMTEAIVRIKSVDIQIIRKFLVSKSLTIDGYKGTPVNFRRWNNQLRQPILLHVHNAVIARAPIDGFLHRSNTLDTLGLDHQESKCNFQEN